MRRVLIPVVRALAVRGRMRWRRRLRGVAPLLASTNGDAHRDEIVAELTRRLARADLSPTGAQQFQSALTWLSFQTEITAVGTKLRAYCDISAPVAVLEHVLPALAAKESCDPLDVALRLASDGNWREPLVVAGRLLLARGRVDEAIDCARRALRTMTACPISQRLLMDALRARRSAGGALTAAEENGLADLRGRFCPRPFEVIVSTQSLAWDPATQTTRQVAGATYACDCAAWVPFVTGNMLEAESADAVINSPAMQEVRRSVLDGDFAYCSRLLCPAITNGTLPRREELTTPRLRRIIDNHETALADGPLLVALGHDSYCNLACPTCRSGIVMANKEESERLDRGRDRVILPLLRDRTIGLHLTAWGDPFASRHYRSILESLRAPEYDGVKLYLLTNGLGLTAQTWNAMPHLAEKIVELRVSVDAATKPTYENVRRPGRWETIRENLAVMGSMNRAGTFVRNRFAGGGHAVTSELHLDFEKPYGLVLAFVVQSANFREMPEFVRMAEEIGADAVIFQKYYGFGHEPPDVFKIKDVASPAHPLHAELRDVLRDPAMRSPIVIPAFLTQMEDA